MSEDKDFDNLMADFSKRLSEENSAGEPQFWNAPDILEDISKGEFPLSYILNPTERDELRELISGLIGLLVRAHVGDITARHQLEIIHTFMFPKQYEVPPNVVEALAKKHRSGHLLRAWALRRLMSEISEVVIPAKSNAESILEGRVRLSPDADPNHSLYELVRTHLNNLKRGTTLQMLAINIYLQKASNADVPGLDERTLKRDLSRLRMWEETDKSHMREKTRFAKEKSGTSWKAQIPIRKYSESWLPGSVEDTESSFNWKNDVDEIED